MDLLQRPLLIEIKCSLESLKQQICTGTNVSEGIKNSLSEQIANLNKLILAQDSLNIIELEKCFKIASSTPTNTQLKQKSESVYNLNMPNSLDTDSNETAKLSQIQEPIDKLQDFLFIPEVEGFASICGMQDVLRHISTMFILPMHQPQLFPNMASYHKLLLHGPPGCGKTQLVQALSIELKAKLYVLTPGNIMNKYVGETEKIIQTTFETLRECTNLTIIFIDEIDAFCRVRTKTETDHNRRIKIEFMHHLSTITGASKLLVIAATNVPWDIDSAVLRRFEQKQYIGLPERQQRDELIQFYLGESAPKGPYNTTTLWAHILDITKGYSNSDLQEVVRYALHKPIEELMEETNWISKDGFIMPNTFREVSGNISCSIYDLPSGCVKARPLEILDLVDASRNIQRTVTDQEVANFQSFLNH